MAELDLTNIADASILTPASGVSALFVDSTSKLPRIKNDGGGSIILPHYAMNQSVANQTGFAVDTYVTGSNLTFPSGYPKVGTRYRLVMDIVKTAAGTAAMVVSVRLGTNGSTLDNQRLNLTFGAATAAVDTGILEVDCHFRTVGSGVSAVMVGFARILHHLAATGLTSTGAAGNAIILATSAGFDSTPAGTIIGVSVNGGASASFTVTQARAYLASN